MAESLPRPGETLPSRLEEILELAWDAYLACADDGTVLSMNAAAERLTGYCRSELVGRRAGFDGMRLLPEGLAESFENVRSSVPPGSPEPELTISLEDRVGRLHTCRVRAMPLGDGAPGGAVGTLFLLTEHPAPQPAGGSNAERSRRFEALTERSQDVIFHLRPDLEVLSVNGAASAVLGYAPPDLVGTKLELTYFLPAEEIRRLRLMGTSSILKEGFGNKLFRVLRRDGSLIWCLLTMIPIRRRGRGRTLLAVLRDVSEFYETREQLELQHAQLKHTVDQLEEARVVQEQFVSNVTHELRTPLTTILITSELLERAALEDWPAPQRRQVELIHKNARVLMEIINDLLDLAKLRREGFKLALQALDLRAFLAGLVEEVEPLFSQKNLSLQLEVGVEVPPRFSTDPAVLRKIITNLLSNASKFTERGGALLSAHMRGGRLRIALADTGIGIARENIPNIFEEFRQLDGSDSRRYPGTGLGLPIADRFTTLLGGRIEVESAPDKGSTFAILLPETSGDPPAGS
jgi:PAS domain S-box-containing protein